MKESFRDRMRRKIREMRIRICKWIIRKAVQQLDALEWFALMVYSWGFDEHVDYHVMKEISTKDFHQFGTKVEYYDSCKQEDRNAAV